ncbi:MAG TPA: prepilin-type N-terminal cleavage/methylation domain-containing protein [Desulfuromonadaceae bacterium]
MKLNSRGFTLVEMLVVMVVFVVIIAITGDSFKTILTQSSKIFRSEESNIEGMVGLEILRHDLQQAGFGLFSETPPLSYEEAAAAPANVYNDAGTNVPRPIVAGNNLAATTGSDDTGASFNVLAGTDYLVVKATSVGRSRTSQKWTYLKYTSHDVHPNTWISAAENFNTSDRVVLLRRQIGSQSQTVSLEKDPSGDFYYAYSNTAFSSYTSSSSAIFSVYGLFDSSSSTPRMPFNRTDYFVARPQDLTQIPPQCAPNTGVLYKTTINNVTVTGGGLNYVPLLDCVADMQVVLGWDMDGDGAVDTYSNANGSVVIGTGTAATVQAALSNANNNTSTTIPSIRNSLKMVKVYILAQQGRMDPGYTSPSPILVGGSGETSLTRSYDITGAGWRNYRWKVYQIVSRPKNLPTNQ